MRAFKTSVTLAAVFSAVCVSLASAQETVVAKVPFSFSVHGQEFPAGRYDITNIGGVLAIRGVDNNAGMFALTMAVDGRDPAGDEPALVFTRDGNDYRLSQIWESNDVGFSVMESSGVSRVSKADVQRARSDARTIVLVANWM